jgi:cytochrome c peroxidase
MVRRIFPFLLFAGIVAFGVFWWLTEAPARWVAAAAPYTPNPKNGEIVFNAGGCSSCHAVPNQPDRTRLGGGLAIPSPFGTFYAPNISQDPTDGLGRWSEADFVNAVKR